LCAGLKFCRRPPCSLATMALPWERAPGEGEPVGHPWEQEGYSDEEGAASDDSENDDPETNQDAAGRAFVDILVDLYLASTISARTFCVLCFYAAKAGMKGLVEVYGAKPNMSTGNYQKHLNRHLLLQDQAESNYDMVVPGQKRDEPGRASVKLSLRSPVEVMDEDIKANASLSQLLDEAKVAQQLPAAYYTNPVVMENAEADVFPYAMFMDGVPYSNVDSVVGIWLVNMLTNTRSFLGGVRKALCCACGCRGWCTWYPILYFLHWGLTCAARFFSPRGSA